MHKANTLSDFGIKSFDEMHCRENMENVLFLPRKTSIFELSRVEIALTLQYSYSTLAAGKRFWTN